MYDPARFFEIVRGLLSEGQLHIFSVPNLFALVNDGQPSLHFEHTILLREEHIHWLLESKGFEIVTNCVEIKFTVRSSRIVASTFTPSTRHLLDGVAVSVPHRCTRHTG